MIKRYLEFILPLMEKMMAMDDSRMLHAVIERRLMDWMSEKMEFTSTLMELMVLDPCCWMLRAGTKRYLMEYTCRMREKMEVMDCGMLHAVNKLLMDWMSMYPRKMEFSCTLMELMTMDGSCWMQTVIKRHLRALTKRYLKKMAMNCRWKLHAVNKRYQVKMEFRMERELMN